MSNETHEHNWVDNRYNDQRIACAKISILHKQARCQTKQLSLEGEVEMKSFKVVKLSYMHLFSTN